MSRVFTAGSIAIHGFVIGVVTVAQLAEVGPLPTPRRALAFDGLPVIKLVDIALAAPRRRTASASSISTPIVSASAAPLDAPSSVTSETGRESGPAPAPGRFGLIGVDDGIGTIAGVGATERVTIPAPAPPPQQPVHLHAGIEAPRKIVDVAPAYPPIARMSHMAGVVILEAVIDARGGVESVRVLRSIPLLDQAAVDAVRHWRFAPARLNGEAIPVVMTVTVNFTLEAR